MWLVITLLDSSALGKDWPDSLPLGLLLLNHFCFRCGLCYNQIVLQSGIWLLPQKYAHVILL